MPNLAKRGGNKKLALKTGLQDEMLAAQDKQPFVRVLCG